MITITPSYFWSFQERKFRYGPARIGYDRAISWLPQGFQLILDREICTFNGQSWSLGNQNISILDFREILLNLNPQKANTPQPRPPVEISEIPTCTLREAPSYTDNFGTPTATKNLFSWKFGNTPDLETEPYRVLILALQVSNARPYLKWVSEEVLHQGCKDMLLEFWEREGGRDTALARDCRYREGGIFSVHCILRHRGRRNQRQYLVEWVGYRERSWIEESDVSGLLFDDYWERVKSQRRKRKHKARWEMSK